MRAMGVDPGTNCGWSVDLAMTGNWDSHESGFWELPTEPTKRMCEFALLWETLMDDLMARQLTPDVVAVEYVHPKGAGQAKVIYGQLAIIRTYARAFGYAVIEVPASQWKKEIVGKGNATKQETMELLGVTNEHEADAIGVRRFIKKVGVQS